MNYAAAAVLGASMLLASCGDDTTDPVPVTPTNEAPTLMVENPDMSQMSTAARLTDVDPNTRVEFRLVAEDADDNLQELVVSRNGTQVTIPTSNVFIEFDGNLGPLDNNPRLLLGSDTTGFSKTINVRSAMGFGDSVTYTFTVRDNGIALANREEASITITLVNGMAPTPLAAEIRGAEFYNRNASTARPGALDLDTGTAVPSSNNTSSELQDQGNTSSGTWRQVVVPENGAELRVVQNDDGTTYSSVTNLDQLLDVFDDAVPVTQSDRIENGDVYVVNREDPTVGSKFYLVQFTEVVDQAGSENDRYVVNIKQN